MSDEVDVIDDEEQGGGDAPLPSDSDSVLGHLVEFVNAQMPVVGGMHCVDSGQEMAPFRDERGGRVFFARDKALIAAFDAIGRSAMAHERSDDADHD